MARTKKNSVEGINQTVINQNTIDKINKYFASVPSDELNKIINLTYGTEGFDFLTLDIEDKKINVVLKKRLGLTEEIEFINYVSENCFDENNEYTPEFYDFVFTKALIKFFTNIADNIDLNILFCFVGYVEIKDFLCSGDKQIKRMIDAIDKKIQYKNDLFLSRERTLLNTQIKKLEEVTSVIKDMAEIISAIDNEELIGYFRSVSENITKIDNTDIEDGAITDNISPM